MKSKHLLVLVTLALAGVACLGQTATVPDSGSARKAAAPAAGQVEVDDSKATPMYANFSRVTGSPEELILDFGLNPTPVGTPSAPIVVNQRVVMNFYTAKRLANALELSIERHEKVFGPIETDISKRMKPRD